ncbi:MAG: hypothetical protein Q9164_003295 [Protoblastenia rupestris]
MATTTNSQHRAQLLREMNKTRHSSGSSRHSQSPQPTISDFDPENEAMMSTRQLDNQAQKLPNLRASAQDFQRTTLTEPDYAIDTSAIGRAFPDFSQGNISSDESSMSIEVGRGAKKGGYGTVGKLGRSRDLSSSAQIELDGNSIDFSAPIIGNYEVTRTSSSKGQPVGDTSDTVRTTSQSNAQGRRASGLRNEIEPSPPAKAKDYGSSESRKGSDVSRRGLAAMHARVRDENDASKISDERPPTVDLTVRNTRFGNGKAPQNTLSNGLPTKFSASKGLRPSRSTSKQAAHSTTTPQPTQQSFMLPDLPNISELVSGVFEDGTPVFSRHVQSRNSRFSSHQSKSGGQNRAAITEIAVPDDEQAIFLSLKLLQDKVAVLEKDKAEAEIAVKHLEESNRQLQTGNMGRRRASHRSDSALGTTDSDGGDEIVGGGQRKAIIERNRLESSVRALQTQLDVSNRKVSTAETIIQNVTQERDSAVSQLGVAYVTIEQLKVENESLKEESIQLKDRINQLRNARDNETQQWATLENALQRKIERRTEAVKILREQTGRAVSRSQENKASTTQVQDQTHTSRTSRNQHAAPKDDDDLFDLTPKHHEMTGKSAQSIVSRFIPEDDEDSNDSVEQRPTKVKLAEKQASFNRLEDGETGDTSKDLTYLSFFDVRIRSPALGPSTDMYSPQSEEIAKLRETIEQERIEQKQRKAARRQLVQQEEISTDEAEYEIQGQPTKPTTPRKSSLKDQTNKFKPMTQQEVLAEKGQKNAQHNRRHSETSIMSIRSRRRGHNAENMTSAFILPDITIRTPADGAEQIPVLTKENRDVLNGLAKHTAENCTVCKRTIRNGEHHEHSESAKGTITVSKPIPVSERMPQAVPGEDEPTMRPAQAPGLALATVLKGLEDEITHLKIKLSQYQTLYNSQDPSLSKYRRKSCYQKMENLLQAIDVKADQIYALYDVLEGQKRDGQDLTEEQVEVTLQSIGMEAPELHLRGGGPEEEGSNQRTKRHSWELTSEEGSDDELPWEGIEPTVESTKNGFAKARGRKASMLA